MGNTNTVSADSNKASNHNNPDVEESGDLNADSDSQVPSLHDRVCEGTSVENCSNNDGSTLENVGSVEDKCVTNRRNNNNNLMYNAANDISFCKKKSSSENVGSSVDSSSISSGNEGRQLSVEVCDGQTDDGHKRTQDEEREMTHEDTDIQSIDSSSDVSGSGSDSSSISDNSSTTQVKENDLTQESSFEVKNNDSPVQDNYSVKNETTSSCLNEATVSGNDCTQQHPSKSPKPPVRPVRRKKKQAEKRQLSEDTFRRDNSAIGNDGINSKLSGERESSIGDEVKKQNNFTVLLNTQDNIVGVEDQSKDSVIDTNRLHTTSSSQTDRDNNSGHIPSSVSRVNDTNTASDDCNDSADSDEANNLYSLSKNFVSSCVESSHLNQNKLDIKNPPIAESPSAYLGMLSQLSSDSSDDKLSNTDHSEQNKTDDNRRSSKLDSQQKDQKQFRTSISALACLPRGGSASTDDGSSQNGVAEYRNTDQNGEDSHGNPMISAYRPFLSFSSLVSGQIIGDEQEYGAEKTYNPAAKVEDPQQRSHSNSEIVSPKSDKQASGSKKKGRSKKSKRNPRKVQDYWQEYLAKYNKMGLTETSDENLKDITNMGSVRNLMNTSCGDNSYSSNNTDITHSAFTSSTITGTLTNEDAYKYDSSDSSSNSPYVKETKSIRNSEPNVSKFTQQQSNQYVHNNKDLKSCQPVCLKAGIISHWSSNMSLHTDYPLINDDRIIKTDEKKYEKILADPNLGNITTLKNTSSEGEDIDQCCLDMERQSPLALKCYRNNTKDETGTKKKTLKSGIIDTQEISVNTLVDIKRYKSNEHVEINDKSVLVERNETDVKLKQIDSPNSVRRGLKYKPPSGAKIKKGSYIKDTKSQSGLGKTYFDSGISESVEESLSNIPEKQADREKKFVVDNGKDISVKDDRVKELEVKMLKTIISNSSASYQKKEEELNFSKSWSSPDFQKVTESSGKMLGENNATEQSVQAPTFSEDMESDTRKTQGRRTISDLGFTYARTGSSRTGALLKNPIMRKHLARTMGLGSEATEEEIKAAIDDRLENTMKQSNLSRSSSTMSLCSSSQGFSGIRRSFSRSSLQRTTSLSGGINTSMCDISSLSRLAGTPDDHPTTKRLEDKSAMSDSQFNSGTNIEDTDVSKSFLSNAQCNDIEQTKSCKENFESGDPSKSESETLEDSSSLFTNTKTFIQENVPIRRRAQSASARFQIPSFTDFKRARRSLRARPASTSFDSIATETIPEEENEDRFNSLSSQGRSMSVDMVNSQPKISSKISGDKTIAKDSMVINSAKNTEACNLAASGCSMSNDLIKSSQQIVKNKQQQYKDKSNTFMHEKKCEEKPLQSDDNHGDSSYDSGIKSMEKDHVQGVAADSSDVIIETESSTLKFQEEVVKAHSISSKKKRRKEKKIMRRKMIETEGVINRSTSDVSDIYAEEERKKGLKERRQKPYKSDPFGKVHRKYVDPPVQPNTNTITINLSRLSEEQPPSYEDPIIDGFEGDVIKDELMNLVKDVQACSMQSLDSNLTASSVPSVDSCLDEISDDDRPPPVPPRRRKSKKRKKKKSTSSDSDIFRADSGVGGETFGVQKIEQDCEDCKKEITEENADTDKDGEILTVCVECNKNRKERKRIISEILSTEQSYGKDLKIIYDEFYKPMKTNGLLTAEQLYTVFINLEELISINNHFVKQLEDVIEAAGQDQDQGFLNVRIGELFLQSTNMLLAFETYCIDHSEALVVLEALEKEREILRIFLEVSQAENSTLRKMHLKAFLVVPVQRIMKYPLLLTRLHKVTSADHPDREYIKGAKRKIEDILEHINYKTKGTASMRLKKKYFVQQMLKNAAIYEDIEIHKVAMDTVGWSKNEVNIVYSGKVQYGLMPDPNSTKRGKMMKYANVQGVLVTLGKGPTWDTKIGPHTSVLSRAKYTEVRQCALVLLKEKNGSYLPSRDTLYLDKCIVSMDDDIPEIFEVVEMAKNAESYVFKCPDHRDTTMWYNHLKFQCRNLGRWRKRRNAMPNIMLGKT